MASFTTFASTFHQAIKRSLLRPFRVIRTAAVVERTLGGRRLHWCHPCEGRLLINARATAGQQGSSSRGRTYATRVPDVGDVDVTFQRDHGDSFLRDDIESVTSRNHRTGQTIARPPLVTPPPRSSGIEIQAAGREGEVSEWLGTAVRLISSQSETSSATTSNAIKSREIASPSPLPRCRKRLRSAAESSPTFPLKRKRSAQPRRHVPSKIHGNSASSGTAVGASEFAPFEFRNCAVGRMFRARFL